MSQADFVVSGLRAPYLGDGLYDLFVGGGVVLELCRHGAVAAPEGVRAVEAKGLVLLPGLTDPHTHLREPGFEWKETVASGLAAAAKGGFANIMCMANSDPVNDSASVTRFLLEKARASHPHGPRLFPVGGLTVGLAGKGLAPLAELAQAGCRGFSNDGIPVANAEIFRRALEYASDLGITVIDHCEDPMLAPHAGINEGAVSARLGLRGQPTAGEAIQVARDAIMAEYLGIPIHLAHVSCRQSVEIIRQAKAKGAPITAETCPHYLAFTEEACEGYNTAAKVNPPLRTREDQAALIEALADGTIDCLCTDHAPHAAHEKETPFEEAPNGVTGLETALSLTWELVHDGRLSPAVLLAAWCRRAGEIFGLPVNGFRPGDPADFLLFDPEATWTVTAESLVSKGKNTPCLGGTLRGVVRANHVAGTRVF